MKKISLTISLLFLAATTSRAAFLPYPERQLKYPTSTDWDSLLQSRWSALKDSFLLPDGKLYALTSSGDTTYRSKFQAYGMMLSVWFGDEAAFKSIWGATRRDFQTSRGIFVDSLGSLDSLNDAGADQDILGALVMASALQDSGYWKVDTSKYGIEAKNLLIRLDAADLFDKANGVVIPYLAGYVGNLNPSRFSMQWHFLFKDFSNRRNLSILDWQAFQGRCHAVLSAQPNASKGMVRNWSNSGGGAGIGRDSDKMGFDAIRVPWQLALDNLWYHTSASGTWCSRVWAGGAVNSNMPGMYKVADGTLFGWNDAGGYDTRLTRAMWGACASSVRDSSVAATTAAKTIADALAAQLRTPNIYANLAGTRLSDTSLYTDMLTLLGALAIKGRAWNVWDDLMNPWTVPDTSTTFVSPLKILPDSVLAVGGDSVRVAAKLSKPIAWKVTFTGKSSGATFSKVGNGDSISFHWKPTQSAIGAHFKPESVTVVVSGAWSDTPEAGKATIRLLPDPSTSVSHHLIRDGFAWSGHRLVFPASLVRDGEVCRFRIMDLSGRTLVPSSGAEAHRDGDRAWIVPGETKTGMRILELETSRGRFRGLQPPVR